MKKLLVLLDTDNHDHLKKFKDNFLKAQLTVCPKVIEVWEIDEDNHMERKI